MLMCLHVEEEEEEEEEKDDIEKICMSSFKICNLHM